MRKKFAGSEPYKETWYHFGCEFMSGERPEETFAKYIKDDRGGFQVDNPDRIFQMFSRGEFSKGLGLGLANVAGIAARHGGKVRVESLPGMGTTFFVHLTKNI